MTTEWIASLASEEQAEARRLLKEQRRELKAGPSQDHEPFVALSLNVFGANEIDSTILQLPRLWQQNVWLSTCGEHGYAAAYVSPARGEYRCRECDRASRRRSYHRLTQNPEWREKERERQRLYRARYREAYNAKARERYHEKKAESRAKAQ